MNKTDKTKLIPHINFLESELQFFETYKREIDWKVYQKQRSKRLEVERWAECLINATLDISKMLIAIKEEDIPETSREMLFRVGSDIFKKEVEAENFSDLAKIRNTLAHRYLDIKWQEIKRFFQIGFRLYPKFLAYLKKQVK